MVSSVAWIVELRARRRLRCARRGDDGDGDGDGDGDMTRGARSVFPILSSLS